MTEIMETRQDVETRTIEAVTAEIVAIRGYAQRIVLSSAIEIGRRLTEAKGMLEHGQWGTWLRDKVDFSQATATRYMRLFDEYADRQNSLFGAETNCAALQNLSVSNALRLLALPEEEREEFAAEHRVGELSAREMEQLMKQVTAERDKARELQTAAERDCEAAGQEKERLAAELAEAREQIGELERRPVEVAVEKADPAEISAAVAAAVKKAEADWEREKQTLRKSLESAEREKEAIARRSKELEEKIGSAGEKQRKQAEDEKRRLTEEVEGLRKQLAMSDAAVAGFRVLFEQAQDVLGRMISAVETVNDGPTADRLREASRQMLAMYSERI